MRFACRFDYYPQPCKSNHYLRELVIDVVCGATEGDEVVAARLSVDHLDLVRPFADGQDIYRICDADSGWEAVFAGLFEPGSQADWRRDFEIDEPINSLLFLHRSVFHPALRDWQPFIIDHVATLFGEDSALVTWKNETDITDAELAALGFRIIAGSNLRLRPNMYKRKYRAADDGRDLHELFVPVDAQAFVDANWKNERNVG